MPCFDMRQQSRGACYILIDQLKVLSLALVKLQCLFLTIPLCLSLMQETASIIKVVCLSVCLLPCISVSFICMWLTLCRLAWGLMGMVRMYKKIPNSPGWGYCVYEHLT